MPGRTLLSRYVRSVRERRGLSVEFISSKVGISAVEYLKFEESPHAIPLHTVAKYLEALSISNFEYIYFQIIARASLIQMKLRKEEEFTKTSLESEKKLQSESNVLSLHGIREVPKMDNETTSENEEC